jgi:Putative rhamnosyl transferase
MAAMKHFVITRIGLGLYNEAKLKKMIDLFEAVTLSSLANQTDHEFVCLIVIDAHMPAPARNKIGQLIDGRSNFCLVSIDVTQLVQVHIGCFDWLWDQCQDFILAAGLVGDPRDYIITSILDADDAWRRDVVFLVNGFFAQRLSKLRSIEKDRTTWIRHSGGMVMTFPRGYQWYIAANKLDVLTMEFHSMAVFVIARFSSGISACSSRHSQWREYSKVLQFDVGVEALDRPMWVYTRHHEGVVPWNASQAMQIDARLENELSATFGVDMEKIRRWRALYPVGANSMYSGQRNTGEQYDRIFRIASFNRKLRALKNQMNVVGRPDLTSLNEEIKRCEAERARLIEKLQG